MGNGTIRMAASFALGVAVTVGTGQAISDSNVGCLVDDANRVFTVQRDGDTERRPMRVNRKRNSCEPIHFEVFTAELPIINREAFMDPIKRELPVGFVIK